jgi:hypothetical protein
LSVRSIQECREEAGLTHEQQLIDRGARGDSMFLAAIDNGRGQIAVERPSDAAERAARQSLKAQIARLEYELCSIVADRFPHVPPPTVARTTSQGPRLLDLGELERSRDRLATQLQELRGLTAARAAHEQAAREQLERMKLEPGRYKFTRLPVTDLGQGGCGVWEVRPRLGLVGMLAGWWQVKLSSGCPLAKGSRSKRDPAPRR